MSNTSSISSGDGKKNFPGKNFPGNDLVTSEACVEKNGMLDTNRPKFSDVFFISFLTASLNCIFIPKALYLIMEIWKFALTASRKIH